MNYRHRRAPSAMLRFALSEITETQSNPISSNFSNKDPGLTWSGSGQSANCKLSTISSVHSNETIRLELTPQENNLKTSSNQSNFTNDGNLDDSRAGSIEELAQVCIKIKEKRTKSELLLQNKRKSVKNSLGSYIRSEIFIMNSGNFIDCRGSEVTEDLSLVRFDLSLEIERNKKKSVRFKG